MSELNLKIGDTSVLDVGIYKDDSLLDIDEYLILFTVKKPFFGSVGLNNPDDTQSVITKSSHYRGGIEKISFGNVRIVLASLDTKDVPDGIYDYDLQLSKPGEEDAVITVDSGTITFSKEITRRHAAL
jgi:hypothetical protein